MRLIGTIVVIFIIAQLLGVYTGYMILNDITGNPYVSSFIVTSDAESPANAVLFMVYILIGAVVMIILIRKFGLHEIIFKILEFVLISVASSIVFYSLLRLVFDYEASMIAGILFGLSLASLKYFRPGFKNLAAIFATAGVGVILGISIGPLPVILFLILLSIYDYISVFKTKHMVEFADYIVEKELAFTVTSQAVVEGKERRIDLGTGDLIAPIILEVSLLAYMPAAVPFVFAGAVVSLGVFLFLVWKKKVVLPALPPLVFGMLLFLLLGMLLGFY